MSTIPRLCISSSPCMLNEHVICVGIQVARQERVAAIKANRAGPGNVSADVAYAVAKSLAKPLQERFSTCAEMRDALASTAAGQRGNVL